MTTTRTRQPQAAPPRGPARLLVFEDSVYRQQGGRFSTDRAFLWFALHLAERFCAVEVLGRLDPQPGSSHYEVPDAATLVPLPHYRALSEPTAVLSLVRSWRTAWSALGRCDVAWLMGPHPVALAMALLAPVRGVRVVLGVRQDLPTYVRHRHPGRRWTHHAADVMEAAWRRLARRHPVVAVGPDLAAAYACSPDLLPLAVSLVRAADVAVVRTDLPSAGPLQLLSVGRLEQEKNPLLLADVLAQLRSVDDRWDLVVCGVGPMRAALQCRLEELGVADHAELRGYVPVDRGLRDVYRSSHALLHVSWTEGVPQVLYEAWAAGLPVVATDVGGVRAAAGQAALVVPPGDAAAAVTALLRVAGDEQLRAALVDAGLGLARDNTMEASLDRLARLLAGAEPGARGCGPRPARPARPSRRSTLPRRRRL